MKKSLTKWQCIHAGGLLLIGFTVTTVGGIFFGSFNNQGRFLMKDYKSLSHTKWDYHVVFIPKRRKKVIYGDILQHLGEIFHAGHKGVGILEGHLMRDHMCLSVPPKYSVVVGYLKGKSAISIARMLERNFTGENGQRLLCFYCWFR